MTFPTDPQMPQPAPRAPLRGWIKALLFVSLAINLAMAGLAIGAALRHGDMGDHKRSRAEQFGGPYTSALTREDRRAIWREMRGQQVEGRPSRAEIQAEFAAVVAALRAEPYDPAQVRAIVGRQFEAGIARQQMGQALLLDRIDGMSPAERAGFADRLDARLAKWREGKERAREDERD